MPVAAATIVAAIVGSIALGGWSFSTQALTPNLSRLNPIAGFGRIASVNGLIELLKALAKFAVVAVVAGVLLWRFGGDFLALGDVDARSRDRPRRVARRGSASRGSAPACCSLPRPTCRFSSGITAGSCA